MKLSLYLEETSVCCIYMACAASTVNWYPPLNLQYSLVTWSAFPDQKFYFRIANVRNFPRGMPPCRPLHEPLFTPAPSPYPSWHIYSTDCWTNVHWNLRKIQHSLHVLWHCQWWVRLYCLGVQSLMKQTKPTWPFYWNQWIILFCYV